MRTSELSWCDTLLHQNTFLPHNVTFLVVLLLFGIVFEIDNNNNNTWYIISLRVLYTIISILFCDVSQYTFDL